MEENIDLLPLVSIITPCYNGENFISFFLNSILIQTYKNIELIFVNDGSVDGTERIVNSFYDKFKKKNISFVYLKQKNCGQAAAINRGLKIFKGDYLIWPDSDDWLSSDSIEKKVEFLEKNKKYGYVRSNGYYCYYKDNILYKKKLISSKNNRFNEYIFDDLFNEKTFCCCGCYMIRREVLLITNPNREILESRGGQNWQIEIPISYNYLCGFIDEALYYIRIRDDSHSRVRLSFDQQVKRQDDLFEIMTWSLKQAKCKEFEKHKKEAYVKAVKNKLRIAFHYNKKNEAKIFLKSLKNIKAINFECIALYIFTKIKILNTIMKKSYQKIKELFS